MGAQHWYMLTIYIHGYYDRFDDARQTKRWANPDDIRNHPEGCRHPAHSSRRGRESHWPCQFRCRSGGTGHALRQDQAEPHAHARILGINAEALALAGIKAVVTAADFPEIRSEEAFVGEGPMNFRDLSRNTMARGKVLYEGHAVAAVAATSPSIAEEAVELIEVEMKSCRTSSMSRRRWPSMRRCWMMISSPRASSPSRKSPRTSPRG